MPFSIVNTKEFNLELSDLVDPRIFTSLGDLDTAYPATEYNEKLALYTNNNEVTLYESNGTSWVPKENSFDYKHLNLLGSEDGLSGITNLVSTTTEDSLIDLETNFPAASNANRFAIVIDESEKQLVKSINDEWALTGVIEESTILITGGTTSTLGDGSTVITYAAPGGSLEYDGVNPLSDVRVLLVAGGGSGGLNSQSRGAGGGGAGGVIDTTITLTTDTYPVTVGAGASSKVKGSGGATGDPGADTIAFGETAVGGGRGGSSAAANTAGVGGSGGGGGAQNTSRVGAAGTAGQGSAGGDGLGANDPSSDENTGGGGGGAGAPGQDGQPTASGAGGDGIASDITGTSVLYGGGGGGSGSTGGGAGGAGGGGAGERNANGEDGTDGLGGGGGAASGGNSIENGKGGDGICIVRIPETPGLTISII